MGGCLISGGSGVLVRVRRDPHGDDEGVYSIPSPARPAPPMSSSATTALSRQPLVQVLRNVADPRDRRGVRLRPAHGPVPGRGGGAGRCPEPDGDTGAHHRPDRRRPALSGAGGGVGPSIGVHHPTGAPGPGARRPRRPLGVMVVDAYRHHQRPQGDSGGRQDHAWSARRRGSGAAPPGRLGPRHGRCAYPGAGGRQDQRDPNPARAA